MLKPLLREFLAALIAASSIAARAGAEVTERFEKTIPFTSGGTFYLENVNGSVLIEAGADSSVQISAEKRAPDSERLSEILIDVASEGSSLRVTTRYARRTEKRGSVTYRVRVPADARVEAQTVNGRVEVLRIEGAVKASTVNGGVRVEDVSGDVEAATVNGGIDARYKSLTDGRHRFSTTNGSVTLELPSGAGGHFDARTVNGRITTDFPVTVSGTLSKRRLSGQFGSGGGSFEITTVNGSVSLRNN